VKLKDYLFLPAEITPFERAHLARTHSVAWWFFVAHVPVLTLIAAFNGTQPLLIAALSGLTLLGPVLAKRAITNPRHMSAVYGITAMAMGAILVTAGRGPMTIEMHFYFFVLLALLSVFGDPMAVITAAVTVALHHLALWALYPQAIFNYDAPVWAVLVHALFVVLESVGAVYVARSFFDNVIGLDRIVQARTAALDARNADLRRVLDNVGQGFLLLDRSAVIPVERATVFDLWFGPCAPGETLLDVLDRAAPASAGWFRFAWDPVFEDVLPMDVALAQLPGRLVVGAQTFEVQYRPVEEGAAAKVLLVITDITERLAREESEAQQREVVAAFGRAVTDREGFLSFIEETNRLLDEVANESRSEADRKRALHTVKGNAAVTGLLRFAAACHALEDRAEESGALVAKDVAALRAHWDEFLGMVKQALGPGQRGKVSLPRRELLDVRDSLASRQLTEVALLRQMERWLLDPVKPRMESLAKQARRLAQNLGHDHVDVVVEDCDLRVSGARWRGVWSSLVHVIRNAVDHGVDAPEAREAAHKPPRMTLSLRAYEESDTVVVEVRDDGRGIDREALRRRAEAKGITGDDNTLLFTDGISSRDEVSQVSGRGVGMSAVRAACEELGGRVEVHSAPGAGTLVRVAIPAQLSFEVPPANDVTRESLVA
jgi:signal transduction histidine kinase